MVVCHCRGVTDSTVRSAARAGARDVETLARLCGARGRCSGCYDALRALLAEMDELVPTARRS